MKPQIAAVAIMLTAVPAAAHHPLDGKPMLTLSDGLLSGVGHPLLGPDHLAFVLVAGIVACLANSPLRAPLAYVVAMLTGCLVVGLGASVAVTEPMIVVSLLVMGLVLMTGRHLGGVAAPVLLAGFGLFHGAAFGTALAGHESGAPLSVFTGYLLGLGATQFAIIVATAHAAGRVWRTASDLGPRMAGAMALGAGLLMALDMVPGILIAGL